MISFNARSRPRGLPAALLAAAALSCPWRAEAAVPCNTLSNPVIVTGGGKVVISGLAKALNPNGITVVHKVQGSCKAVDAIVNDATFRKLEEGTSGSTPDGGAPDGGEPDGGVPSAPITATYWNGMADETCDLDPDSIAEVGISDVFATTCNNLPNGLPESVLEVSGPVEAYAFAVAKKSTQKSISRSAAYFAFGFGSESGVEPWTDPSFLFQRDTDSGTQQMMSVALGIPLFPTNKWRGQEALSSGDLLNKVNAAPDPERSLGIATVEAIGLTRSTVNILAYQDTDQRCGYWPDSNASSTDKKNVRDGHYPLWGALHLLTKVDAAGVAIKPVARELIAYLTGTEDPPNGFDLISLLAKSEIIPECAMQVTRDRELGPLASFAPARSCGCYFEKAATGTTSCKACTSSNECPATASSCNYGYCEAQ